MHPAYSLSQNIKIVFLLAWKFTQIQLPRIWSLDIFQQYDLFSLCLMFSLGGLPYVANSAWPVPGLSSTNVAAEKDLWKIRSTCNWTAMSIHWDVLLRDSAIGKEDRTRLLHHPCLGNVQHQLTSCFYLRQFWQGSPSPNYMVKYKNFIKKRDSNVLLCITFDMSNSLHLGML